MSMDTFELDIACEGFSKTLIYAAIMARSPQQVLQAIHNGESVHTKDPEFHTTYLHLVVNAADTTTEENLVSIIYQLSNAGINVDALDYKGKTALEMAILRELHHMMVALIRVGADLAKKDYKAIIRSIRSPFQLEIMDILEKYEPGIWSSVEKDNCGMVQLLVNSWCRVNAKRDDQTLLELARSSGKSQELITTLVDYQVTLEFVHATLAGDEKRMLEYLMDSEPCDPFIMDISHQVRWSAPLTPRSLRDTAIAMGHTDVLHLLPEDDFDQDEDIKGYLGGVTLETTTLNQNIKNAVKNGKHKQENRNGTRCIGQVKSSNNKPATKPKPMKAVAPQPPIRSVSIPQEKTQDISAQKSKKDKKRLSLQLDLLDTSFNSEDEQSYEQSRFTGSVAVRSRKKSRKPITSTYSVDDWSFMNGKQRSRDSDMDQSESGFSDMHTIDHIATPRGKTPKVVKSFHPSTRDYSKNWFRASLKSSSEKKSKAKEIRSKMCVIS